jgi:D-threo-aldose 1-dehydrogenase
MTSAMSAIHPGRTGQVGVFPLQSSCRVGFGTGGLLRIGSRRERDFVLAAALDSGVAHFDTAPIYGFGEAERTLGRFLQRQRHRVTLTTKFGLRPSALAARLLPLQRAARRAIQLVPALRRAAVRNSGVLYTPPCFSVQFVRKSLESSLRALRTDYVDFFLAHQASSQALPTDEVIGLMEDLQRAGKIRGFGVATDFDWLLPVLERRPQLSRVVQFDSEVSSRNVAALGDGADRLLITYGFIGRAVAASRELLQRAPADTSELVRADDETLGGWLLRACVLANPHGMVLMQSRSPARIARNVRAASSPGHDDRVRRLVDLLRGPPS